MDRLIHHGFILAGLTNIGGILLFSAFFTNEHMVNTDPLLFNSFGMLMIILWGLAYIATAGAWRMMRPLVAVFAIEKLAYGWAWILWISANGNQLDAIFDASLLAGAFYSVYGVIDLTFCAFFSLVWLRAGKPA